ncbi:MAG: hypothetical protein RPU34_12495 [Candidatus Sedimenticola sp. (ex Thyasira tokunagai)]
MADFVNVAGGQQWRKYTGGEKPRHMSFHMLFFVVARSALPEDQMELVYEKMRDIGAEVGGN